MGRPNVDIFTKGISRTMMKNPFIRMGDTVSAFACEDPAMEEFEKAQETYENTKSGAPENGFEY